MGAIETTELNNWGNSRVNNAQAELDNLNAQIAELGVDAALTACSAVPGAGIACDFASLGVSVSRGDWLGAALDLVGFVPVIGDGIKAGVRGGEILRTGNQLQRALATAQDAVNASRRIVNQGLGAMRNAARAAGQLTGLRQQAARRYWSTQRAQRLAEIRNRRCTSAACRRKKAEDLEAHFREPWGTRLPRPPTNAGTWRGSPGNGFFTPDPDTNMGRAIADYNARNGTNLTGVQYNQGFPDFGPYTAGSVDIPNMRGDLAVGGVNRPNGLGDVGQARAAWNDQNSTPFSRSMEDGFTWHHQENGTTMSLVDSTVHNATPHTGGASMMGDVDGF